jgi:TPR repeat protein
MDRQANNGRHHVTHRPSTSTAWTRAAFAAIALVLSLAAPVAAGPLEDGNAAYGRADYAAALRLLGPLANQGVASAQGYLGLMYENGRGVPPNYAEAMKWYRLAADQGEVSAQINLGVMYATGRGVPQDYVEALKWFRLAAGQGELWRRLGDEVDQAAW